MLLSLKDNYLLKTIDWSVTQEMSDTLDLLDGRFLVLLLFWLSSNGDFTINLVDNLLGSNDLISVRGRAAATKPFTLVEALRREADDQFRVQEQALQTRLRATEQKIASLQSAWNGH